MDECTREVCSWYHLEQSVNKINLWFLVSFYSKQGALFGKISSPLFTSFKCIANSLGHGFSNCGMCTISGTLATVGWYTGLLRKTHRKTE
jgi:hypothetical protein